MKKSLILLLFSMFFVQAFFISNAGSEEKYPSRPISMVVPSAAGMTDTIMRVICRAAEKDLGQPIIIENKPGGSSSIALSYVVKSAPDGYTLGLTITGFFLYMPQMIDLPYSGLTDITDIMAFCKYNFGLCVRANAPWNSIEDIIAFSKKNPGKFTYGCYGTGSSPHILMERIALKEGNKWTQVPFKSGGEAVLACVGGHTDAVAQGSVDVVPQIKSGKLKLLLVLDKERWPTFPKVPTIMERGYNFCADSYMSIFASRGLPESIRQKLDKVFKKAMDDPSFIQIVNQFGLTLAYMSGKEYETFWKSQYEEVGKVLRASGLVDKKKK